MKRALCWIMSVILLLNSCPPAFAAACNFESMLKDSYDPGWMNMECVRDFACYCREKNRKTNYCVFKGEVERGYKRFREKFDKLYLDAATEDQGKFKLYRIAKVSCAFTFPQLRPKDINDKYIPRNKLTQWDYCSKTLQEKVQDKVDKKEKSVSFCFGSGEEPSVLSSKIKRLAEMDEESLKSAISTLVIQGSNKPGDPTYVHPLIFEAAFAFLAQKLTNSDTSSISRYLNSDNLRVQWSAANALATYAVGPNNPEGKFTLEDTEKAQITQLFNNALLLLPKHQREGSFLYQHIVARLGNIYQNPITDSGLQRTLSAPQTNNRQLAAAVGVLSVPFATAEAAGVAAAELTAAMESASVAPLAFAVGATLIIFYALNSAFNVGFRIKFKNAREKFWNSVEQPVAINRDDVVSVLPRNWTYQYSSAVPAGAVELMMVRGMARITLSRSEANVWSISTECNNPNRITCRDLEPWVVPSVRQDCRKHPLTKKCVKKEYGATEAYISDKNDDIISAEAANALQYEDLIASTTNPAVPVTWRIAYHDTLGWLPYGEISMAPWDNLSSNNQLKITTGLSEEEVMQLLEDFVNSMLNGVGIIKDIQCGGGKTMQIRIGRNEVQGGRAGHFHLEEIKTFDHTQQKYICNHGIYFPASSRVQDFAYALLGLFY